MSKTQNCYMNMDSFIVLIKTYLRRHYKRCCNKMWYFKFWSWKIITQRKKVTGLISDDLGGKIIAAFVDWKSVVV